MVKIEDIFFWIFIIIIIGTSLWMLHGSLSEMSALITIGLAVASSELLIWKYVFNLDKKTALGFMKMKYQIEKNHLEVNNKLDSILNKK